MTVASKLDDTLREMAMRSLDEFRPELGRAVRAALLYRF